MLIVGLVEIISPQSLITLSGPPSNDGRTDVVPLIDSLTVLVAGVNS